MAAKKKAKKVVKKAAPKKAAKKAAPKKVAKKAAPKKAAKKVAPKKAAKKATPKKAAKKASAPAAPAAAPAEGGEATSEGAGDGSSEPPRAGRPKPAGKAPVTGSAAVQAGDAAPYFELLADDESTVKLSALRGKKVVLYFYPRDNTPGCTIEARDFSALQREFEAKNAIVLGVSTDGVESHRKFKRTCELSVKLLTDPERLVHEAYGAWGEKNMYGRKIMGTVRSTFLIDEDGRVARVWPKVKVADHALEVLNSL
jgi:peroxiredoxin Q/BCP